MNPRRPFACHPFSRSTALAVALVAFAAAAVAGWTNNLTRAESPAPYIRIVDVRPLTTSEPALRDLITHTFQVRVAITDWKLLPYRPGARASDNRRGAGHWRLYLDGHSLGDKYGSRLVAYTPYLTPGTHWIAAALTNHDGSHPKPRVWSEPVILHVPRVVRCWQTGWRGSLETGTPEFSCNPPRRALVRPSQDLKAP